MHAYWETNKTVALWSQGGTKIHYFKDSPTENLDEGKKIYKTDYKGKKIGKPLTAAKRFVEGHIIGNWCEGADLSSNRKELDLIGEFMELVSPYGAHALDVVFGDIGDGLVKLFVIEANGSDTRGDPQGTNFHTGRYEKHWTIFDDYVHWAVKAFNNDEMEFGRFVKHMLHELDDKARHEYARGLTDLWRYAREFLEKNTVFCYKNIRVL